MFFAINEPGRYLPFPFCGSLLYSMPTGNLHYGLKKYTEYVIFFINKNKQVTTLNLLFSNKFVLCETFYILEYYTSMMTICNKIKIYRKVRNNNCLSESQLRSCIRDISINYFKKFYVYDYFFS